MAAQSYYNAAHFAESFKKFDDLRESGQTCDIRILASNKEISAHKLVLVSASEYFRNAIYGLFLNDSGKNELELKEVRYEILSAVINYMYTGKIEINSENVCGIYDVADLCLMDFLKEKCFEFLEENLDVENCVKIWFMANNCKHDKLMTAVANFLFSNLELVSNTKEFLSLSKKEILDFFKLWPKDELYDSFITSVLKWAAVKENWEETTMNILKDIPHSRISDNYLVKCLAKNEFIQNHAGCKSWMLNIYKEKFESRFELEPAEESELKLKFTSFLSDQPVFFLEYDSTLHKYSCSDTTYNFYNKINFFASDCETYKHWIYIIGNNKCDRFAFDDLNKDQHKFMFHHKHNRGLTSAILNDSMYIFCGNSSEMLGSRIDLNTQQTTNFNLLRARGNPGVAVSDTSIYICNSYGTDNVERFDPREGRTTKFTDIDFKSRSTACSAAIFSNQLHCTNGVEFRMIDLRRATCLAIERPAFPKFHCLFSSYGKVYTTNTEGSIYEYNNISVEWQRIATVPGLGEAFKVTSFK